jgi:hypothetical protein
MRVLPEGFAAALESGAAGIANAWILHRNDGVRLGFTDHDLDLAVQGVTCAAATGWTLGAAHSELGAAAGLASATGALDSAALTEADIAAGRYDGARIEMWRVLWSDPAQAVLVWKGTIARLARDGAGFTAEIEGPLAALERVVGRTYGRACDAVLGDTRCRVDLSGPAFHGATCDKTYPTCRARFANQINFQGFPDIPGDDFLAVVATAGALNDGGSRR